MIEAIGVIDEIIVTKVQDQLIPPKEKAVTLLSAVCCIGIGIWACFTPKWYMGLIMLFGGLVFLGKYRAMRKKYFDANVEKAKEKDGQAARYKVRFSRDSLTVMDMDGNNGVNMPYNVFRKSYEIDDTIILATEQKQMVFISKKETDPEMLEKVRSIMYHRMPYLNKRKKGDWL